MSRDAAMKEGERAVETAEDYQRLILVDILEWYAGLEEPGSVPNNQVLHPLLREAKVLVEADRNQKALDYNEKLQRELGGVRTWTRQRRRIC